MSKKFDTKWNFMQLSTDEKPNPRYIKVREYNTLYEMDTGDTFIFYEGEWQPFLNQQGTAGKPNKAKAFCNYVRKSTDKKPDPRFFKVEEGYLCYELDTGKIFIYNGSSWEDFMSQEGGGGGVDVDTELSDTSTNPVQNKVITEALGKKADVKEEHQVIGWTSVNGGYVQLDLRPFIAEGCSRFTILCYIRKGNIRQGIKFELTLPELNKFFTKAVNNVLCIPRMCLNPTNENQSAMLKQCIKKHLENSQPVDGVIEIMHNIFVDGVKLAITELDNFECCMYAE